MNWLKRLKTNYIIKKHGLPDHEWHQATQQLPLLDLLTASEKTRLRVLSTLLIHDKTFTGVQGFKMTLLIKIVIAAQACLEILHADIDSFDGWQEIIVYPGAFKVVRETMDEFGLVHLNSNALSGEAWTRGPLILSWDDVERDSYKPEQGHHVVLHEFAHKLDMLNGRANGMPPLHPTMPIEKWTDSLSKGYEKLTRRVESHHAHINAYATTNPAEFFAVMCEYFFTAPEILEDRYPDVYQQLKTYFKMDTLNRKKKLPVSELLAITSQPHEGNG